VEAMCPSATASLFAFTSSADFMPGGFAGSAAVLGAAVVVLYDVVGVVVVVCADASRVNDPVIRRAAIAVVARRVRVMVSLSLCMFHVRGRTRTGLSRKVGCGLYMFETPATVTCSSLGEATGSQPGR